MDHGAILRIRCSRDVADDAVTCPHGHDAGNPDETFPDLDDEVLFPRLSDAKLAWFAKRGERRTFEPGEVLYEHAVRDAPFFVIERGLVEFVDRKPGKDVYIAQADGRTFIGDIAVFTGEPTISAAWPSSRPT